MGRQTDTVRIQHDSTTYQTVNTWDGIRIQHEPNTTPARLRNDIPYRTAYGTSNAYNAYIGRSIIHYGYMPIQTNRYGTVRQPYANKMSVS